MKNNGNFMDLSTRNGDLMVNNGESWDDMGFTLW